MPIIGVDYGSKRIGLALAPTLTMTVPLSTLTNQGDEQAAGAVARIAKERNVHQAVVGLALHANGDESETARAARNFGAMLADLGLDVSFHDESGTTKAAHASLGHIGVKAGKRKSHVDAVAAQAMLQSYLESSPKASG